MKYYSLITFPDRWGQVAIVAVWIVSTSTLMILASCSIGSGARAPAVMPEHVDARYTDGAGLYRQHCAACHGSTGEGNGRAASIFEVRPRAFRLEPFRFVSTASGRAPSQDDLMRTIRRGVPHTEMPATNLGDAQINSLASYIREVRRLGIIEELSRGTTGPQADDGEEDDEYEDGYDDDGYDEEPALSPEEIEKIATRRVTPGPVTPVPPRSGDFQTNNAAGRALFIQNCAACHGPGGRGDGKQQLKDSLMHRIQARDITSGAFRGGDDDRDLYWRIRLGLPGTPMPGLGYLTDDQVWQLVDYIRYLSKGGR